MLYHYCPILNDLVICKCKCNPYIESIHYGAIHSFENTHQDSHHHLCEELHYTQEYLHWYLIWSSWMIAIQPLAVKIQHNVFAIGNQSIALKCMLTTVQMEREGPKGQSIKPNTAHLMLGTGAHPESLVRQARMKSLSLLHQHNIAGQEKPHNVHLAPEYEYRAKHLAKAHKNWFKTCSMASNTFRSFCQLSCGPGTCMKLSSLSLLRC